MKREFSGNEPSLDSEKEHVNQKLSSASIGNTPGVDL